MNSPVNSRLLLVTGASGYVGGRLVRSLVDSGARVRVFVRDAGKIQSQPWFEKVEVVTGSAQNVADLEKALAGVHTAFYLLHSINLGRDFDEIESRMAFNFSTVAAEKKVSQIVYLGGIANDANISKHLNSRVQTGANLAKAGVPVLELRAGIVIGSGSASFEMLRHLTHRLPIMTTPKWVTNLTQPIAIRDVLWYLRKAAELEAPVGAIYDIGGPEVLTYADMMQSFAKISGLRKRWIIKVPVLTPKLSSLWIGFVTPVPTSLARPLVESLISEVGASPSRSIEKLIPPPPEGLIHVSQAIELALSKIVDHDVETRWSDAAVTYAPWQKTQSDPSWAGDTEYKDHRHQETTLPAAHVWKYIEGIGGEHGWYGSDWLWWLRGLMDRMVGGVGLRRGRRDPDFLHVGESLDFWRVEKIEKEKVLRLYAEMILPGKAWLEFRLSTEGDVTTITQEAIFTPNGLGGRLYWFAVLPLHAFLFPTMLRNLLKKAESELQ